VGLCSQYLWDLAGQSPKNSKRLIFGRFSSTKDFEAPPDLDTSPILLIANGTGISPFRSFWKRWEILNQSSSKFLYYGCRSPAESLYADELDTLERKGILKTRVIFSRFKLGMKSRGYVQHLLYQHREEVVNLINKNARIFVCGSLEMRRQLEVILDEIAPHWRNFCIYQSEIF
ncbi:hypothetical protein K7432_015047, partial [Basidiobolus ranarum]